VRRLLPGRRLLSGGARRRRHGRSVRPPPGGSRRARRAGRSGASPRGRRGPPLGGQVHPRHGQLPVRPALRPAGVRRGVLPQRRPAPPTPPPRGRRRVGPHAVGRPAPPVAARRRRGPHAGSQPASGTPPGGRAACHRQRGEGNAFFVEELVGATELDGRNLPDDLADLLLVRLDRLDEPGSPRRPGRFRRWAAGVARACCRASWAWIASRSTTPCARRSRRTSWCRREPLATHSGMPCSRRPSTTTCCPASGFRLHAGLCGRPVQRVGGRHRCGAGPPCPGRPRPARSRAGQRSRR
jgi:hypothetical protein